MIQQIEQLYNIFSKNSVLTTDSRIIREGCIFAALKGEHFDGNDFALKVAEQGIAAAVIADRPRKQRRESVLLTYEFTSPSFIVCIIPFSENSLLHFRPNVLYNCLICIGSMYK